MSTTDAQFRASVRADAIKAGCPSAVADYLAAQVGKVPTTAEREHRDETRGRLAGYRMTGKSDALDRIAWLFSLDISRTPVEARTALPFECPFIEVSNLDERAGNAEAKL